MPTLDWLHRAHAFAAVAQTAFVWQQKMGRVWTPQRGRPRTLLLGGSSVFESVLRNVGQGEVMIFVEMDSTGPHPCPPPAGEGESAESVVPDLRLPPLEEGWDGGASALRTRTSSRGAEEVCVAPCAIRAHLGRLAQQQGGIDRARQLGAVLV